MDVDYKTIFSANQFSIETIKFICLTNTIGIKFLKSIKLWVWIKSDEVFKSGVWIYKV